MAVCFKDSFQISEIKMVGRGDMMLDCISSPKLFISFHRFYSRDSGLLKFKIHAGFLGRPTPPSARRLVAFTFHPLYPFAISVQRTNAEYVVNFHIRHLPIGVEHV